MTDRILPIISLVSTSILAGVPTSAFADPSPPASIRQPSQPAAREPAMPASHGLEIALALGSTASRGDIGDGMNAEDLIGSAARLELAIGSRVTPNLTLGFYGNAQASPHHGRRAHTGAAGLEAAFHLRPDRSIDPWISLGSGVRAYLVDDGGYTIGVGAELARLQVGVDFRASERFAIGPVVGVSASLFGAEKQPMQDFHELSGKGINWTLSAGIAGRFHLFGRR